MPAMSAQNGQPSSLPGSGAERGSSPLSVVLRPSPASTWALLAQEHFDATPIGDRAHRATLAVVRGDGSVPLAPDAPVAPDAPDAPVVMTGHQLEWWHAGILAKFLAGDALATRAAKGGAGPSRRFQRLWVAVDQDDNDPGVLRVPVVRAGGPGGASPGVVEWNVFTSRAPAGHAPIGFRPVSGVSPVPALEPGARAASGVAEERLSDLRDRLARGAGAGVSLADQIARAICPAGWSYLRASDLLRWSPARSLVAQMASDARACAGAYNRAVRERPEAGLTLLSVPTSDDEIELPLWVVERAGGGKGATPEGGFVRRKALVRDLRRWLDAAPNAAATDGPALAPRALLMTTILRWWACDLFIHGLGGEVYDPVMEAWLAEWLGGGGGKSPRLAPAVTVSATLRLRFDGLENSQLPTLEDVTGASWTAHRARHDPALLDDPSAVERKRALVAQIASLRSRARRDSGARAERRALYRELHALLDASRRSHADALESLTRRAALARERLEEARLLSDRTWWWALHAPADLERLRREIESAAGA